MSLEECDVTDLGHPQGAMLARRGHTIGKPRSAPGTVSFHTATSHAAVDDSKPDCDDQSDCQGSAPGWNYYTAELPAKGLVDSRLPARPHQQHHVDTRHVQQAKICQISVGFCLSSLLCRATLGTADKLKGPRGCLESLWALHLVHHPGEQQAVQL